MRRISNILAGIGILAMIFGGCALDSAGAWMYTGLGLWFGGMALVGAGASISIMAERRVEKERRQEHEAKIKRDRIFDHWCSYRVGADLADTACDPGNYSTCQRSGL